jgi:hypothetical protein
MAATGAGVGSMRGTAGAMACCGMGAPGNGIGIGLAGINAMGTMAGWNMTWAGG